MNSVLVLLALAASSPSGSDSPDVKVDSLTDAVDILKPVVKTGTLLVSKGECLAVRVYTQSPYTHVAAVVCRDGKPFVYDSANGVGTRCLTLENYLRAQSPDELHVFHPKREFDESRARMLEEQLDSQLGRPYAVRHHLTGKRSEGLHCSEYISEALRHCGTISVNNPAKVSPASLVTGITRHDIYSTGTTIQVVPAPIPEPPPTKWYRDLWNSTKACTANCFLRSKRVILCQ